MKKTALILAFVAFATTVFATTEITGQKGGKKTVKAAKAKETKQVMTLAPGYALYDNHVPTTVQKFSKRAAIAQAQKIGTVDQLTLIYTNTDQVLVIQPFSAEVLFVQAFYDLSKPAQVWTLVPTMVLAVK